MSLRHLLLFLLVFILGAIAARSLDLISARQSGVVVDFAGAEATGLTVTGMASKEEWGRWSDGSVVTLTFEHRLPPTFDLFLLVDHFSPLLGKTVEIKSGAASMKYVVNQTKGQYLKGRLSTGSDSRTIQFIIPEAESPRKLGLAPDDRKIGLGFRLLGIAPVSQ